MAATAAATNNSVPSTYLLAAIHDCDGASPALNTKSGAATFEVGATGAGETSRTGELTTSADSFTRGFCLAAASLDESESTAGTTGGAVTGTDAD